MNQHRAVGSKRFRKEHLDQSRDGFNRPLRACAEWMGETSLLFVCELPNSARCGFARQLSVRWNIAEKYSFGASRATREQMSRPAASHTRGIVNGFENGYDTSWVNAA